MPLIYSNIGSARHTQGRVGAGVYDAGSGGGKASYGGEGGRYTVTEW